MPIVRQGTALTARELRSQFGEVLRVGDKPPQPVGMLRGAVLARVPLHAQIGGNLERRMRPAKRSLYHNSCKVRYNKRLKAEESPA